MAGHLITFEGIDGAGKSTHLRWLAARLEAQGLPVTVSREPGGTALGERLRDLLLQPGTGMDPETEALLVFAARREHLAQVILPALARGNWVLCDRFTDATFAYQGYARGVSLQKLRQLERWVQEELRPDHTLVFDLDPSIAGRRAGAVREPDRFESEQEAFHRRVREGYLAIARAEPARVHVLDASLPLEDIQKRLEEVITKLCSL